MELYSPQADYDLETVSLVIYSFLSTVLVGLIVLYACFPELQTSQKIGTLLKKYLPASVTNTKGKVGQYDSEVRCTLFTSYRSPINVFDYRTIGLWFNTKTIRNKETAAKTRTMRKLKNNRKPYLIS